MKRKERLEELRSLEYEAVDAERIAAYARMEVAQALVRLRDAELTLAHRRARVAELKKMLEEEERGAGK